MHRFMDEECIGGFHPGPISMRMDLSSRTSLVVGMPLERMNSTPRVFAGRYKSEEQSESEGGAT